jgi:rSAM/selenodomain-associated transferase 1
MKLLVFAKAPVPGQVKTRLAAAIGAAAATRLHEALVGRTLAIAVAADVGDVVLCCAPDASHPFFARMQRELGVALEAQVGGDLGERMASALSRHCPAVLVGCDCPALSSAHLEQAARALARADVVLTPAEDGGYVLVGVNAPQPQLFAGMTWGHAGVLAETRARIAAAELRGVELETLWDLDRPEDLRRLHGTAVGPPHRAT